MPVHGHGAPSLRFRVLQRLIVFQAFPRFINEQSGQGPQGIDAVNPEAAERAIGLVPRDAGTDAPPIIHMQRTDVMGFRIIQEGQA